MGAVGLLQAIVMGFAGIGEFFKLLDFGFEIPRLQIFDWVITEGVRFTLLDMFSVGAVVTLVTILLGLHIWHLVRVVG